jgi:beta-galactosidase
VLLKGKISGVADGRREIKIKKKMRIGIQILGLLFSCCLSANAQRTTLDFNRGWKFWLGDTAIAADIQYNDAKWRLLDLPHDWSIEGSFSDKHPATNSGGALPGGIGWYRKTFTIPATQKNKPVYIAFDGIYRNSEVWINGHYLGKRPNGYISFRYELTPWLKFGAAANTIAVRVDNSAQPNSRWYTGSGIYRNVQLVMTGTTAVDHWGTFITTPKVSAASATVAVNTVIRHTQQKEQPVTMATALYDAAGKLVHKTHQAVVIKDSLTTIAQQLEVTQPNLWSVHRPYLYKAVTRIIINNQVVDSYTTPFGMRYFAFDVNNGFSLNGEPLRLLGVCQHHDLGALGAAINVRAMERQLQILKDMGCNAIRTAHNPPAPELLDLCDRMGFLVMDEAFDMWRKRKNKFDYHMDFDEWHRRDLEDQVKRDRNHPSVFMWSIGNEIREQFDSTGIPLTQELVRIVKSLDSTRPVTAALTELDSIKNYMYRAHALDVIGINYNQEKYDSLPLKFPFRPLLASETTSGLQTRGHYSMPSDSVYYWPMKGQKFVENGNPDYTVSAYDQVAAYWGTTHEDAWKKVKQHPFLAGLFVWSGFDFLGEPVPYPWPARSSYYGIIDLAGFPKDVYYMYQSEWTNKPVLHVFPHWNHEPGKMVDVWAYYSQADEVELFLNNRSLGVRKKQGGELHVLWRVPFEPGMLRAESRKNGRKIAAKTIETADSAVRVELLPDRKMFHADGKDLVFITARIVDKKGNLVPDAGHLLQVKITGQGRIAGIDNGYPAELQSFKALTHKAYRGLCLIMVQSTQKKGAVNLQVKSDGLLPAALTISAQ